MSARTRFIIHIIVAVALGLGAGFAGGVYFQKARNRAFFRSFTPERMAARQLDDMTRELALTDQQRAAVDTILDHQREKMMVYWKESMKSYKALGDSTILEIKSVLTDEQRVKYDTMLARIKARFEHKGKARR